jgi:hypothetical protein
MEASTDPEKASGGTQAGRGMKLATLLLFAPAICITGAQDGIGRIRVDRGFDSFSNTISTNITIRNNDPNPDLGGKPAFVVTCGAKAKKHWVRFALYTGGLDTSEVTYDPQGNREGHFESKCGNKNPLNEHWAAEANGSLGNTLFYANPPKRYTRYLVACGNWTVRYQGSGGGRTATFDLSDLQLQLDKYPECKQ